MSTGTPSAEGDDTPPRPKHYAPGTGADRYVRFAEDWLGLDVAEAQARMLRALEQHRRVVVSTANGVGKSYGGGAAGGTAALYCNPDTTVNITSGSYGQLDDTIWKPIKSLHRQSDLPGRTLDNTRELRTEFDEEWYLRCLSPKYPADLEGRHNARMVYIIEEADKPGITHEHIDSAASTLTDEGDRMLVICNPPADESNVVYDLIESESWHTIRLSSFDSRNVRVDAGETDAERIPGLVGLQEVRENWTAWNDEPWPGIDEARTAHEHRDDLDERWYRRRAGVMPPQGASAHRPIDIGAVRAAYDRTPGRTPETPSAVGIDVARSGDETVVVGLHDTEFRVHYAEQGTNHTVQAEAITALLDEWASPEIAVDAVGEGSHLADELDARYPNVTRFKSGSEAAANQTYRHKWAEALAHLGDVLAQGAFASTELRRQALAAARTVAFEERYLKSRDAAVLQATSKESVTDTLGHSPDYLDAAAMAAWAEHVDQPDGRVAPTWSF